MTLDDPERQNRGFSGFFGGISGCKTYFKKRIAPKSILIDMEKWRMKFSALNMDFDGPSLDFRGSRKLRTRASKSDTPVKVVTLQLFASLSWKRLQINMGMLPIATSTSDQLFSHINTDDFERPWISKIKGCCWFLRSSAAADTLQERTSMKWL